MKQIICMVLVTFMLVGCGATESLLNRNDAGPLSYSSIAVNKDITIPEEMYFLGGESSLGSLFGVLGSAASHDIKNSHVQAINQLATDNNIKIDEILRQAVVTQLDDAGKISPASSAENTMTLTIDTYGFSIPNGFSKEFRPVLYINAEITDQSGSVVWENKVRLTALRKTISGEKLETLKSSPETIRRLWTEAAGVVAERLIN